MEKLSIQEGELVIHNTKIYKIHYGEPTVEDLESVIYGMLSKGGSPKTKSPVITQKHKREIGKTKQAIINFISAYRKEHNQNPTYKEVSGAVGASIALVNYHLNGLDIDGVVGYRNIKRIYGKGQSKSSKKKDTPVENQGMDPTKPCTGISLHARGKMIERKIFSKKEFIRDLLSAKELYEQGDRSSYVLIGLKFVFVFDIEGRIIITVYRNEHNYMSKIFDQGLTIKSSSFCESFKQNYLQYLDTNGIRN